jgi:ATP-binding cassette, subfamily B, bacterial
MRPSASVFVVRVSPSITIDGMLFLLSDIVKLVALAGVTVLIDWRLGVVALSIAPLLSVLAFIYHRRVGEKYKGVRDLQSSAFRVFHEALSTIRVVKAFVQEAAEQAAFEERSKSSSDARIRLGYADAVFGAAVNLTAAAGMAMVLYVGIHNVQTGRLTLGSLLLVITYLSQLYAPLQNITYHLASLKASSASLERAFEVLEAASESAPIPVAPLAAPAFRAKGAIRFDRVTFAYGSKTPLIRQFSADLPAGSRIGVIGRTGSGKTTIVNLLVRFISPQSGRILLDGVDIASLDLAVLRRQFAFVLQEPVLFSTTIAQNIAYGRPAAPREAIIEAAKAACAHDFIQRLPQGYDTNTGERGFLLSGGERQCISIARAFLVDSPILILDEPTSSVDVRTEAEVLQATERLMAGRTCFFISHHLHALSNCDYLFKLSHSSPLEVIPCHDIASVETFLREGSKPEEHVIQGFPAFPIAD